MFSGSAILHGLDDVVQFGCGQYKKRNWVRQLVKFVGPKMGNEDVFAEAQKRPRLSKVMTGCGCTHAASQLPEPQNPLPDSSGVHTGGLVRIVLDNSCVAERWKG